MYAMRTKTFIGFLANVVCKMELPEKNACRGERGKKENATGGTCYFGISWGRQHLKRKYLIDEIELV